MCYTPDIGWSLAPFLEDSKIPEIRSTKYNVSQFFHIRSLVRTNKPLRRWILINMPDIGKAKAVVQYERLRNFCYFCGRIGHLFSQCHVMKNTSTKLKLTRKYFLYKADRSAVHWSHTEIVYHEKLHLAGGSGFIPISFNHKPLSGQSYQQQAYLQYYWGGSKTTLQAPNTHSNGLITGQLTGHQGDIPTNGEFLVINSSGGLPALLQPIIKPSKLLQPTEVASKPTPTNTRLHQMQAAPPQQWYLCHK